MLPLYVEGDFGEEILFSVDFDGHISNKKVITEQD
jgi:hypothetical protein